MKTFNSIGDNIAWIRSERGLTQHELADDIECSRQYISDIERGKRRPSRMMIKNIAEALQVEVEELEA